MMWRVSAGNDGGKGYVNSEVFDTSMKGDTFWEDWLGPQYSWITPKLNWTPADCYNFEDLNRVENITEVVAGLVGYFIALPQLVFMVDRDMKRIEFADSFNRIESNQDVLQQRFTPVGWLQNKLGWEANEVFSFRDAHRLEHNLNLLYKHYKRNTELVPFCGAFICGEEAI